VLSLDVPEPVIDADGHILEPLDLWDRYIDPEFLYVGVQG
jgi:hypothetical protein